MPADSLRLHAAEGVRLEPMGDFWVAYSPWSGLTTLLNTQSVAILEILGVDGATLSEVASALAESTGDDVGRIEGMVRAHLPDLQDAGLLERRPSAAAT